MMVVQYFLEGGETGKAKQYIFLFPVFSKLQTFPLHSCFFPISVLFWLICSRVMFALTTRKLGLVFLSNLKGKAAHLVFELKLVSHNNLIDTLLSFK